MARSKIRSSFILKLIKIYVARMMYRFPIITWVKEERQQRTVSKWRLFHCLENSTGITNYRAQATALRNSAGLNFLHLLPKTLFCQRFVKMTHGFQYSVKC